MKGNLVNRTASTNICTMMQMASSTSMMMCMESMMMGMMMMPENGLCAFTKHHTTG